MSARKRPARKPEPAPDPDWGPLFRGVTLDTVMVRDVPGAPAPTATLADAQAYVRAAMVEDGTSCPCCGRFVKLYRRGLNSQMARFIVELVGRTGAGQWCDITRIRVRGGDYAKLQYWGLIEQNPDVPEGQRSSGVWRATVQGRLFVYEKLRVPSHVLVFDSRAFGYDAKREISIRDALGAAFDYDELLAARPQLRQIGVDEVPRRDR